jgi:hypothetical protein
MAQFMTTVLSDIRFEDIGPEDEQGQVEWAYCGRNLEVDVRGNVFLVRIYDDEPTSANVVAPPDAIQSPEAGELVRFLSSHQGLVRFLFFSSAAGSYRPVNGQTLEFMP